MQHIAFVIMQQHHIYWWKSSLNSPQTYVKDGRGRGTRLLGRAALYKEPQVTVLHCSRHRHFPHLWLQENWTSCSSTMYSSLFSYSLSQVRNSLWQQNVLKWTFTLDAIALILTITIRPKYDLTSITSFSGFQEEKTNLLYSFRFRGSCADPAKNPNHKTWTERSN